MGITVARRGEVAVVTMANPPVNAIGVAKRRGLLGAVMEAQRFPHIRAVVLAGSARAFAAGADAREFDGEPMPPHLPEIANASRLARSPGSRPSMTRLSASAWKSRWACVSPAFSISAA